MKVNAKGTSGSYSINDCHFLLDIIDAPKISIEEKEFLLQSGKKHYSEMISEEDIPDAIYLETFHSLVAKYKEQLAAEITKVSGDIVACRGSKPTLISLARAGTPFGILIKRALKTAFNVDAQHFSVSIIRDRGLDYAALEYLEKQGVDPGTIIFVDGWTAKGAIKNELTRSVAQWNSLHPDFKISSDLCVISDIAGVAEISATNNDYAIPSAALNSTVSGLLSRTLNIQSHQGFHQCVRYNNLEHCDLSNWFVDQISALFKSKVAAHSKDTHRAHENDFITQSRQSALFVVRREFISNLKVLYGVKNTNHIKPGVAEATRAMLRRIPRLLLVNNRASSDAAHLLLLAIQKNIPVKTNSDMPFSAVVIIEDLTG